MRLGHAGVDSRECGMAIGTEQASMVVCAARPAEQAFSYIG